MCGREGFVPFYSFIEGVGRVCGDRAGDAEGDLKEIEAWYRSHPEEQKKFIKKIRGQ